MHLSLKDGFSLSSAKGGKCYLCGRGDYDPNTDLKVKVISTGISIDFEGDLDICAYCVRDMAKLIGMADSAEADLWRDLQAETKKALDAARHDLVNKDQLISLLNSELRDKLDPLPA